ncbi:MAG: hypothetical protein CMK07_13730 [Ponticaulis sp.]|nr:hypothetical protein [Ponticaulis sp.]
MGTILTDFGNENAEIPREPEKADEAPALSGVRKGMKRYFGLAFILSLAANILLLVSPLYMIQVYDRVLSSGSYSTLLSLSIVAVFLLAVYAFAEAGRRRALAVYGRKTIDREFKRLASWLLTRERLKAKNPQEVPNLQDVTRVQTSLTAGTILPFFDLPFSPLFLLLMFLLHPLVGIVGLIGAVVLIIIAFTSEKLTSKKFQADQKNESEANNFMAEVGRSANALIAMGMRNRLLDRWSGLKNTALDSGLSTSSFAGLLSGLSKSMRQILQTIVLGVGAYLALGQEMSPGGIVAGSIVMGRMLAPIDQIVGGWKQLALAQQSWKKIRKFSKEIPEEQPEEDFRVSEITTGLVCQNVSVGPPGAMRPVLNPFNLTVNPGEVVMIVGPIGSGKSTILQTLSAAWPAMGGEITLGNRAMASWADEDRGRFVGYLPQKTELLPGTIAENIARFEPGMDEQVEATAKAFGFHELFMSLPEGYSTVVGDSGQQLSAGQKQSIGLVRASFGDVRLLLLDEPTANLDLGLANRFVAALKKLQANGVATVITTHDMRLLPFADKVFTTKDRSLVQTENPTNKSQPLRTVPSSGGAQS